MDEGSQWRKWCLSLLTTTAHGSSPFITTFLLIHLAAPALATVGGSSLSSQTLILGREYYQTNFGEKYLVLGPIALHGLSAIAKRLMSPPGTPPRPLSGSLSVTGCAALLCFLPIHFLTHRLYPTTPNAPIHSVGPSELDFEFVKFGLQTWPYRSWFLYGGLLSLVAIHATDGTALLWKTWFTDAFWRKGSRRQRPSLVFGTCVLPVLTGVYLLAKEPLMVFKSTASRFRAVYMESFVYRI